MNKTFIDIHILQTVPPSNLNRDDTGSPKSAVFGGVRRARVSSQAWKRAVRVAFADELDKTDLGVRTLRVVERVANRAIELAPQVALEEATAATVKLFTAAKIVVKEPQRRKGDAPESTYLLFLSTRQVDALAAMVADMVSSGTAPDQKQAQALIKNDNSIDLALFGRMVADVSDLNVDASCQVSHAISTHGVESEYDYFTAVDDHKAEQADEDAGAGMIGTVEFNSATLYRYATIDASLLYQNLGDLEATRRAVSAFLRAFVTSMPTGKQNTFANRTLPEVVVVSVRGDQPVSYVAAFEEPVVGALTGGRSVASAERLAQYAQSVIDAYGTSPIHSWVVGLGAAGDAAATIGDRANLTEAVNAATSMALDRIADGQS